MGRVIHFEVPADDPERARGFYRDAFGWDVTGWQGGVEYYLATTGPKDEPGIDGALLRREAPVTRLVVTIAVDSLDATLEKVVAGGGRVLDGKRAVNGVGWHAYCEDTEGNVVGVLEPDPGAA